MQVRLESWNHSTKAGRHFDVIVRCKRPIRRQCFWVDAFVSWDAHFVHFSKSTKRPLPLQWVNSLKDSQIHNRIDCLRLWFRISWTLRLSKTERKQRKTWTSANRHRSCETRSATCSWGEPTSNFSLHQNLSNAVLYICAGVREDRKSFQWNTTQSLAASWRVSSSSASRLTCARRRLWKRKIFGQLHTMLCSKMLKVYYASPIQIISFVIFAAQKKLSFNINIVCSLNIKILEWLQ